MFTHLAYRDVPFNPNKKYNMRTILLLTSIVFLLSTNLSAQVGLNSNNYYDYYSNGEGLRGLRLTTAWLNKHEVAEIVKDEMREAGFEWLSTFRIVTLDSVNMVVSVCYSEKSNFGFLYESAHRAFPFPVKEDRQLTSLNKNRSGNDYSEKIILPNGESTFLDIERIPDNLHIIMENIYWYQYTEINKDARKLVSKEDIIDILRADIRLILENIER